MRKAVVRREAPARRHGRRVRRRDVLAVAFSESLRVPHDRARRFRRGARPGPSVVRIRPSDELVARPAFRSLRRSFVSAGRCGVRPDHRVRRLSPRTESAGDPQRDAPGPEAGRGGGHVRTGPRSCIGAQQHPRDRLHGRARERADRRGPRRPRRGGRILDGKRHRVRPHDASPAACGVFTAGTICATTSTTTTTV